MPSLGFRRKPSLDLIQQCEVDSLFDVPESTQPSPHCRYGLFRLYLQIVCHRSYTTYGSGHGHHFIRFHF